MVLKMVTWLVRVTAVTERVFASGRKHFEAVLTTTSCKTPQIHTRRSASSFSADFPHRLLSCTGADCLRQNKLACLSWMTGFTLWIWPKVTKRVKDAPRLCQNQQPQRSRVIWWRKGGWRAHPPSAFPQMSPQVHSFIAAQLFVRLARMSEASKPWRVNLLRGVTQWELRRTLTP